MIPFLPTLELILIQKKTRFAIESGFDAESEGFEPPVRCRTMVFKTTAFDHSANSPRQRYFLFQIQSKLFEVIILVFF